MIQMECIGLPAEIVLSFDVTREHIERGEVSSTCCPIALAIKAKGTPDGLPFEFGEEDYNCLEIVVHRERTTLYVRHEGITDAKYDVTNPDSIRMFARTFDIQAKNDKPRTVKPFSSTLTLKRAF